MIESLGDPYSSYLTSEEYEQSLQGISGQFEGIGAEMATEAPDGTQGCATLGPDCTLVVVAPLEGSPAEKAGLRPGDFVIAADGARLRRADRRRRTRSGSRPEGNEGRADRQARRATNRSCWRSPAT